jgi:8-hydroxy-5-deazaflavin:NADPH oxidoreductase
MADALGTRWAAAGHELMVAGRTEAKVRALADKWGARSGSFREAAEFGDIALIAVLYQGMHYTLTEIGDALRGKRSSIATTQWRWSTSRSSPNPAGRWHSTSRM